jgi:hypothetical protein
MSFTFEKLQKLNLKHGEIVRIKYPTVASMLEGKIATNHTFNIESFPIFDSTKTKIYFHLSPQTNPTELDIEQIECFIRLDTQPMHYTINGQIGNTLKNFTNVKKGLVYDFLKTNGDIESLRFHSISYEPVNKDDFGFMLNYYAKDGGKIAKINFYDDIIGII